MYKSNFKINKNSVCFYMIFWLLEIFIFLFLVIEDLVIKDILILVSIINKVEVLFLKSDIKVIKNGGLFFFVFVIIIKLISSILNIVKVLVKFKLIICFLVFNLIFFFKNNVYSFYLYLFIIYIYM